VARHRARKPRPATRRRARQCPPLPQLSTFLTVATVRFDLSGCGASGGEPQAVPLERDLVDIRSVILHVRQQLGRNVLGVVGVGLGGTAALAYAAAYPADLRYVVTVGARVTVGNAFSSTLTWSQLQQLQTRGALAISHADAFGRSLTLSATAEELEAPPNLDGLGACAAVHFLALFGTQDASVAPAEAARLEGLLAHAASSEVRTVPGVGASWEGDEATLAYAIGEWLWRVGQPDEGVGGGRGELGELQPRPSGFNIFVDSLALQVKEIHAEARAQLPSMPSAHDRPSDDDDDDDEAPILTTRYSRQQPPPSRGGA